MADWILAIDYGTTFTAAATRLEGGPIELLYFDGSPRLTSMVVIERDGTLLTGRAAENVALLDPSRVVPTPKRRVGEGTILAGSQPLSVVRAVSAVLRSVLAEARRQRGGTMPRRVYLTHPAGWSGPRLHALREAAADVGIADPVLIPEPVAAALHFLATGDEHVEPGETIAIYDLGGGTFDAAVLRRTADGWFEVIATGGNAELGGEDFDERVYRHLGSVLAQRAPETWQQLRSSQERPWISANAEFRRDARTLKEDLSTATTRPIYLRTPADVDLQLTRQELEDLIRPDAEETLDELDRTLAVAGLRPDQLAAIYLVGGSSRMRLLEAMVRERFGRADTRDDPKAVVALGAAYADLLRSRAAGADADHTSDRERESLDVPAAPPGVPDTLPPTVLVRNPCPSCGSERPLGATSCMICGAGTAGEPGRAQRPRTIPPWAVGGVVAAVLVVGLVGAVALNDEPPTPSPIDRTPSPGVPTHWTDLATSDCYVQEGDTIDEVSVIACDVAHDREVFEVLQYEAPIGDPYPADIVDASIQACDPYFTDYVGIAAGSSRYDIEVIHPVPAAWEAGVRDVVCVLYLDGDRLVGSKEGTRE